MLYFSLILSRAVIFKANRFISVPCLCRKVTILTLLLKATLIMRSYHFNSCGRGGDSFTNSLLFFFSLLFDEFVGLQFAFMLVLRFHP